MATEYHRSADKSSRLVHPSSCACVIIAPTCWFVFWGMRRRRPFFVLHSTSKTLAVWPWGRLSEACALEWVLGKDKCERPPHPRSLEREWSQLKEGFIGESRPRRKPDLRAVTTLFGKWLPGPASACPSACLDLCL